RRAAEAEYDEQHRLRETAERDARLAERYRSELERERETASTAARREAERIVQGARGTADAIMAELTELRRTVEEENDFQRLNEAKAEVYRRLNEAEAALREEPPEDAPPPTRKIVPGDRVKLGKLGTVAEVISVSPDGVLSLQAGIMNITAKAREVRLIERDSQPEIKKYLAKAEAKLRELGAAPEVDLRGMMSDEAVAAMELYLDGARMANLETVTVIHGKGTGALRAAVHRALGRDPYVKSYRLGRYGEGETGVTVVELK
ncbi:MAG: Smr/MutS family protein, partial [Oscillospiraceae bacterium]|nr:Smr/MutS family protein [Oscillospiraceae bacterium]